jgi:hypothetical protein
MTKPNAKYSQMESPYMYPIVQEPACHWCATNSNRADPLSWQDREMGSGDSNGVEMYWLSDLTDMSARHDQNYHRSLETLKAALASQPVQPSITPVWPAW